MKKRETVGTRAPRFLNSAFAFCVLSFPAHEAWRLMIDEYLARIGYTGPRDATSATLRALHVRHLLTVPFENLDIHLGREIVPEERRILDKIVTRRRGGFCYELNGAFAVLLRALGF